MKALDCADVRDGAPEFVFGVLDGASRADIVYHLERCPRCRTVVAELSETADSVVLLAPETEPPAGFEHRVMATIMGEERRRRWRTAKLVAVAAAAAVILSVVTVRIVDQARGPSDSTATATAPAAVSAPMIGSGGEHVGQVEVRDDVTPASLTVTVGYALDDGVYRVVLDPEDAGRQDLGSMTVSDGHGSWAGGVPLGDGPTVVALVDETGRVFCSATLPAA